MTDPRVSAAVDRVAALRERIERIERPFDHPVSLLAVTKGHGGWAIDAATTAGCDGIGENYAQEMVAKRDEIVRSALAVHFIGRLQRNKVRQLVGLVDVWATLDRPSVIDEVARRAPGARVSIQVDTSGDPGKGGCPVDEVGALVDRATAAGLQVTGLLTVGPTGAPAESARAGFRTVRTLADTLGLASCSMGMSDDLVVAIEEGSTEVRVGSAIFGPRPAAR